MTSWYIIDASGTRHIERSPAMLMPDWPAFAMISARAEIQDVERVLMHTLAHAELLYPDEQDAHPIYLHAHEQVWTLATELHADPDAWTLTPQVADALSEHLLCPLAYLSHDLDTGAIHLDLHDHGALTLRWQDALDPGLPSDASLFCDSGTCTQEDARQFALRLLDLPAHTPTLDRHAFIELMLARAGLTSPIDPASHANLATSTIQVQDLDCAHQP